MLVNVIAKCQCDVCGNRFDVAIDPAYTAPAEWALFDVVEDKVRGSFTSAVRGGVWMCSACEIADRAGEVTEFEARYEE